MIKEKYVTKALLFAAVVYGFIILSLAYLLFLNTGLEMEQLPSAMKGETKIIVKNTSSHVIRDLNVFLVKENGEKTALAEQAEFFPDQNLVLTISENDVEGKASVIATAPFHLQAERIVSFERVSKAKLSYDVTMPSTVFADSNFFVELKVCNNAKAIDSMEITESHDAEILYPREGFSRTVAIASGACDTQKFEFRGAKEGKTEIYFKLKAPNVSEEIKKEVTVLPS